MKFVMVISSWRVGLPQYGGKIFKILKRNYGALVLIGSLGTLIHKLGMTKLFGFCVEINTRLKRLMIPSYKE